MDSSTWDERYAGADLVWPATPIQWVEPIAGGLAPGRRTVLQRAATAVTPSGHLLVMAHDATNFTAGVGGPQDPRVLYTCAEVEADLAGSGLVIERRGTVLRAVETENGPRHAVDALLLAIRPGETTTLTRTTQS